MTSNLHLTLVRHAKSSWRFAELDDFHRPLNKRGLRDVTRMPKQVAARIPAPERLISSDAVRAVQTCQAMADVFGLQGDAVVVDHDLYLAEPEEILALLAQHGAGASRLMVVGHNPGLTDLYNLLVEAPLDNLPTLAVASLILDAPGWGDVAGTRARDTTVLLPKELLRDE